MTPLPAASTGRGAGYAVEPGAGLEAGTTAAPYALSDVFASGVGNYFSFEFGWDQAMMMFQPVGGMDRIPYAFEKAIGRDKIRVRRRGAVGLSNTASGVAGRLHEPGGQTKVVTADFAICTLPPHLAAKIPGNLPRRVIDGAEVRHARPTPARSASSTAAAGGRRTTASTAASPTPTSTLGNMWYPSPASTANAAP